MIPTEAPAVCGNQQTAVVEEEEGINIQQNENTINWGDPIHVKHKHHFRILTLNVNGLPQHRDHSKYGTIGEQVNKFHIDIIGMSEINLKWNKFSCYDRLTQRTSKWWENTYCSFA